MRRIDRILLNALEHKVTDKSELPDDGNISGAPSELEADSSKDINCQDDEFQDASNPLCPSMSLAVIKANEIVGSDVESPAAPSYSPLTPLLTTQKAMLRHVSRNFLRSQSKAVTTCVESPAAPVYSPLTPLTTRKEAENNNSPMPPMSQSTLELLETLNEDFFTVRHEYDEFAKRRQSNGISKCSNLKED
ncbi:uncharacterized protein LOC123693967 isoform X2 [Colias croceus]|uniref:uncharacterized protein LOC123693967 isoform X2 n=1 Tax=Colias crocea TaxID=72248 RepID=UPI001E2807B2|nr:uncharacterized protein LOC123693967 isoform X2 [Colias croceus]